MRWRRLPRAVSLALSVACLLALPARARAQRFELVVDALDPQACGGSGCWTNHMRLTDLDGDDDLDLLLVNYPDFFSGQATTQPLVVYENDGAGGFTNVSATAVGGYVGSVRQIAVGDIDGDGDRDLYAPSAAGELPALFVNDGAAQFVDETATRLPAATPAGAAARLGDVDNDGDLDLFVSDGYAVGGPPFGHLYLNDGAGAFQEAIGAIPTAIAGEDVCDVEFFDADRDLDLDLVLNAHGGGTGALWLNDGTGVFAEGGSLAPPATGSNFHYNVTPCDVDGDGDLDLWIDNTGGSYTEQLLINDGSAHFADETSARVTGNPSSDDNGVACADVDADGDLDAVVLSLGTAERLLENDGTGHFTYVAGVFPPPTNCTLWGELGDLDGDDRMDLVTAQGECSSSDEVYRANTLVPADDRAPVLGPIEEVPAAVAADAAPIVRFAVADAILTDEGPRIVRAWAVVDPAGAPAELAARPMGGDLYRVVLPAPGAGEVTFRLCAEDPAGNVGCSTDRTYAGPPPPDAGVPDSAPVDAAAPDGAPGAADASAPGADAGGAGDDGGGCGCRVDARPGRGDAALVLLGALLLLGRTRSRRPVPTRGARPRSC